MRRYNASLIYLKLPAFNQERQPGISRMRNSQS